MATEIAHKPRPCSANGTRPPLLDSLQDVISRLPAVLYQCGPPPDFKTIYISDNVHSQFGYLSQEFYSDPFFWTKRIHRKDRDQILQSLATIGNKDALDYEYRFRRLDGEYCWLHDQVCVIRDDQNNITGLIGSWFDITHRRRLEMFQAGQAQVLDYLVKRRSLEDSLIQIVRMMEEQDPEVVCTILRYDPVTQAVFHVAAPGLPDEYKAKVDGLRIGPVAGSCGTALYRRERVVVTDIESDPLWVDFRELARSIGMRACWSQPIFASTNQMLGTFAMYYRKPRGPCRLELELIEQAANLVALAMERYHADEKSRHSERLVSLGTLAAGIAHEINNPLGGIQLAIRCATNALASGQNERIPEMLSLISDDAERCARIVHGVLQFGRRDAGKKQPVELVELLKVAIQLTRGYASERGATVDLVLPEESVDVVGFASELVQVFVNLVRNAIESKETGVSVVIELSTGRGNVCVAVSDDGRGMTEEQQKRIFDPFFTTRQKEGGTGLGMSIVHGIVSSHDGLINIKSRPGEGTCVIVCLPRVA